MARTKQTTPYKGPRKMRAVFTVLQKMSSATPSATAKPLEKEKIAAPTKPKKTATAAGKVESKKKLQ